MLVEQIPNLRLLNLVIPGRPHLDFILIAPKETVGNDAMLRRQLAREHVGLNGPGHAGKARRQRRPIATADQPRQIRHRGEVFGTQARNGQQN